MSALPAAPANAPIAALPKAAAPMIIGIMNYSLLWLVVKTFSVEGRDRTSKLRQNIYFLVNKPKLLRISLKMKSTAVACTIFDFI
jgi:hypothetical protein